MQVLTSPRNPLVKEVRKAILRGGLTDDGLCVAEGFHLLEEALRGSCEISPVFVLESARAAVEDRVGGLRAIRVIELPDELFHSISSTEASQGVIALVRPPAWTLDQLFRGQALVVVLDGVQDPGNGGAIVRSAEAFGATGVVFLRASAGSVFRVPMVTGLEERALLAALDPHEIETYALAPGGAIEIAQCHFERPCALVVGSEGRGVSEGLRAKAIGVRIPTVAVESLNAAMAAGIALYEARRKRVADEPV
jgi:TrmH family RNA methyltransferase